MRYTPIVLISAFVFGCGSGPTNDFRVDNPHNGIWQNSPEVPMRIVLEQTFGVEDEKTEEMIASMLSVTTDGAGNVYFLDWRMNQIVSFDSDGSLRWRVGRAGDAPGELRQPVSMMWNGEDLLYVTNHRGARIDIFDLDGNFVTSSQMSEYGLSLANAVGFFSQNRLVVTSPIWGATGQHFTIFSIGNSWIVSSSFDFTPLEESGFPEGISTGVSMTVADGGFFVSHNSEYRFDFYDESGNIKRVITRTMDDLVRPGIFERGPGRDIRRFGGLGTPKKIQDGFWLVTATWPTNIDDPDEFAGLPSEDQYDVIMKATVDLYDQNWRLLYSWTELSKDHPGYRNFVHVDSAGRLYGSTDAGFPQLGRYRVDVIPPN